MAYVISSGKACVPDEPHDGRIGGLAGQRPPAHRYAWRPGETLSAARPGGASARWRVMKLLHGGVEVTRRRVPRVGLGVLLEGSSPGTPVAQDAP